MSLQASQSSASYPKALLSWGAIALCVMIGATGCEGEKKSALDLPSQSELPAQSGGAATQAVAASTSATKDDRLLDKTFDDLKFDIEPGQRFEHDMLSDNVGELLGKRIRIRGYILPTFQRKGLTQFILVRDDQECCFGPGAALYDCIVVEMQPGKSADFAVKPVAVEGRLTLQELMGLGDTHLAIFHLDGELVE